MTLYDDQSRGTTSGNAAAFEAHAAECDECRAAPLPLARIATLLNTAAVPVDAAALSQRTLVQLQPALGRLATAVLWRKASVALLLSLLPLPAVLAYDAYLLRLAYALVSVLLPATLAAYVIFGYAAFLVLLFATTYAAIPVLLGGKTSTLRPTLGPQAIG